MWCTETLLIFYLCLPFNKNALKFKTKILPSTDEALRFSIGLKSYFVELKRLFETDDKISSVARLVNYSNGPDWNAFLMIRINLCFVFYTGSIECLEKMITKDDHDHVFEITLDNSDHTVVTALLTDHFSLHQ